MEEKYPNIEEIIQISFGYNYINYFCFYGSEKKLSQLVSSVYFSVIALSNFFDEGY